LSLKGDSVKPKWDSYIAKNESRSP
jgi:hypothetical protein